MIFHDGLFYVYFLARDCLCATYQILKSLTAGKCAKKKTAKDYWYDFMKSRADRRYLDAQEYVDKMDSFFNK